MSQPKKSHQCACFIHFIQLTIPRKVLCILIVNQHYWLKLIDPESVIKICQDFGEGACYTCIVEHKVQSLVMSELWLHTTIKSIHRKANISKLILIWNHKILWNKQHVRGIVSCLKSWGSGQLVHIQGRGGEGRGGQSRICGNSCTFLCVHFTWILYNTQWFDLYSLIKYILGFHSTYHCK